MKKIQSVKGMHDCVPKEVVYWKKIESIFINILNNYGYNEIRFPIVEFTSLFSRSVGQMTDVVEKEMYSFYDQGDNSLTLRPEGTSGCVRAAIENSLFYNNGKQRLWYLGPMFRRERPQKGRYRQFHQFSAESFGYAGPDIDVELILITVRCWALLGISEHVKLELNSIGSLSSRLIYQKKLVEFLQKNINCLNCDDLRRLKYSPLRILDTKNSKIQNLLIKAPVLSDYLDDDSQLHFNQLCQLLDLFKISYTINPYLVRGLDYYNRTVFEWVTNRLGSKKAICAGGRYDNLVETLGGQSIPAIGFSVGLERILLLMKTINSSIMNINMFIHIYIIYIGGELSQKYAMLLSEHIRNKLPNLRLMVDYGGGNFEKQLNRAIKNNSNFILIVEEKNVVSEIIILKNLYSGKKEIIKYPDIFDRLNKLCNK